MCTIDLIYTYHDKRNDLIYIHHDEKKSTNETNFTSRGPSIHTTSFLLWWWFPPLSFCRHLFARTHTQTSRKRIYRRCGGSIVDDSRSSFLSFIQKVHPADFNYLLAVAIRCSTLTPLITITVMYLPMVSPSFSFVPAQMNQAADEPQICWKYYWLPPSLGMQGHIIRFFIFYMSMAISNVWTITW
jgi:hypothetical protein